MTNVDDQFQEELNRLSEELERVQTKWNKFFDYRSYVRGLPPMSAFSKVSADSAMRLAADTAILASLKLAKVGQLSQSTIARKAFKNWDNDDAPAPSDIRNNLYRLEEANLIERASSGKWKLTEQGEAMFAPVHDFVTASGNSAAVPPAGGEMPEA